jgi:GT2 family glycosyltransferase
MEGVRISHRAGLLDCIVVDNCSEDGTVEYLRTAHPWARVIESPENLGFGRGCNLGLDSSSTPYVLLLNPDAVLPSEALETLIGFLDAHPGAGVVGPAILGPEGLQHAGGLPTPRSIILHAARLSDGHPGHRRIVPGEPPFQTNWLSGAILLIRRTMLERLGGFDPRFFLYFEETDLFRRAVEGGWEIWAIGEATGRHAQAGSVAASESELYYGCIAEHYFKSRFYYLVKHHGWLAAALTEIAELVLLTGRLVGRTITRRPAGIIPIRLRSPICRQPRQPSPVRTTASDLTDALGSPT